MKKVLKKKMTTEKMKDAFKEMRKRNYEYEMDEQKKPSPFGAWTKKMKKK